MKSQSNFKKGMLLFTLLFCSLSVSFPATAQFQRDRGNPFKPPQATVHTPRERDYHDSHLKLIFDIDAVNHSAHGVVTHSITPLKADLKTINIDAGANLKIESCRINNAAAQFKTEGDVLSITPVAPLVKGKEVTLEITYSMPSGGRFGGANGLAGWHWIDPNPNDPARKPGFWTQGETDGNHHWVPCYDSPNDKLTSETIVTVPESWTIIGNGTEGETKTNLEKHTKTYRWTMKQPHSTYLLSLVGGELDVVKASWQGVPLYYVVPKGMGELAMPSFGYTPDMLSFFSYKLGVKYPWPKYAQSAMYDFGGGMENVSATTLGLSLSDARGAKFAQASLISHELAHQWFGDLITCNDWGDVWLNEGFATFFQTIYAEHLDGMEGYDIERDNNLRSYLGEARRYKRPISTNLYSNGDVMFDSHTYPKGGLVLHMLRREMGDKAFFHGLGSYLNKYRYQPVDTHNLVSALSEDSGQDVSRFFDQWVFKPGHPVLNYTWNYDAASKAVILHVKQLQDTTDGTPIYTTPLAVELLSSPGSTKKVAKQNVLEAHLTLDSADQEFRIPSPEKPDALIVDPHHDLLKEFKDVKWEDSELPAILRYASSHLDRADAASRLANSDTGKSPATLQMFAEALKSETSGTVGGILIRLLGDSKNTAYRDQIRKETSSKLDRRRIAALRAFGKLPATTEDTALLRKVAMSDTELYSFVESAMAALAEQNLAGNLDIFKHQIGAKSYRDRLAVTTVRTLADAKLDAAVPILVDATGASHTNNVRTSAIRGIGTLAANSAPVHAALVGLLNDANAATVQEAAIRVLKDRQDKGAVSNLRDVATHSATKSVRDAATEAADSIEGK